MTNGQRRQTEGMRAMSRRSARRRYEVTIRKYYRECCASRTPTQAAELARYVGRNRTAFSRTIRDLFGKPVTRILLELRLEEAKRLLRVTDVGLDEVAAASAFGHRTTLHRAFTRAFGMTPAEYRARVKEGVEGSVSDRRKHELRERRP